MQAYFGNLYVNDFVKFGRVYRVQTEALPEYRSSPDDISKVYVRARNGTEHTMIPLDSVVYHRIQQRPGPGYAFQRIQYRTRAGRRRAGIQLGAGAGSAGASSK